MERSNDRCYVALLVGIPASNPASHNVDKLLQKLFGTPSDLRFLSMWTPDWTSERHRGTRARSSPFSRKGPRLDKWLTRRAMFSMQHRFTRPAARRGTAPPRPGRPAGLTFENSTVATESGAIPQSMRPAILPERQLRLSSILTRPRGFPAPDGAPRLVSVLVSNGQVSDRKRINATVKDAIPKSLTASTGNCDSINCDREPWGESKELGMCACCLRIENVSRIHYGGANGSP